jgi:hypothetical protein
MLISSIATLPFGVSTRVPATKQVAPGFFPATGSTSRTSVFLSNSRLLVSSDAIDSSVKLTSLVTIKWSESGELIILELEVVSGALTMIQSMPPLGDSDGKVFHDSVTASVVNPPVVIKVSTAVVLVPCWPR